ncbi:MAG: RNA-binding protein [Candidatus Velthaea sp.]|jgi:RNA recognition motif-containing protein
MRLFVGGLPRTATKEDVVRLFRQFGVTEEGVVLPRDRRTHRRKGFAYVDVPDAASGERAIAVFSGFEVEGKPLTVCAAENRPLRKRRSSR